MKQAPAKSGALTIAIVVAMAAGCGQDPEPPSTAEPAHVEPAATPGSVARAQLTPEATQRIGIETGTVELRAMPHTRTYGGALEIPAGRAATVVAPLAGLVAIPDGGAALRAGARVAAGSPVFALRPMGPPDQDLLRLETAALARVEEAQAQAARTEQMLRDRVGSDREVEQARAALAVEQAQLATVQAQLEQLNRRGEGAEVEFVVPAPIAGQLVTVPVVAGQIVDHGTALFTVSADDPLWVRVPVYAGDLAAIDRTAAARIGDDLGLDARPVSAPPSGDAVAGTVDLFYEVPNREAALLPGQRVDVRLALRSVDAESRVVARGALLYDVQGLAWVYANPEPGVFVRQRVEVARVVGDLAVLSSGPPPGTSIVTIGAAELYGTEFGVDH